MPNYLIYLDEKSTHIFLKRRNERNPLRANERVRYPSCFLMFPTTLHLFYTYQAEGAWKEESTA